MAEDINTSANFGQKDKDGDELPVIVAQRFLNIFRQLHIFSDERREAFNKMLLELPIEVKNMFRNLPGGTPLQEYMEDIEQKSKGLKPIAHSHKNNNILQTAIAENKEQTEKSNADFLKNNDFAQILANSLAQSNAEIIQKLQNTQPSLTNNTKNLNGSMKLVADESFTNIISKALTDAIENSEKKRLEDNKMIVRSFTELQENLTKLVSSNNPFVFPNDNKNGNINTTSTKNLVDDLVKAQSSFLKEITQNQKEELSSLIATAIKESQKISTQTLIESFKKINDENKPLPITYATASPNDKNSVQSVEQALKIQGKEFSSIISMALKESQKNSAQTIIETLEKLKKDTSFDENNHNTLKVEEIMRMQANLFRDIARAQNQEFSVLISSALKESQKQSTEAIINALKQIQPLSLNTVSQPILSTIPQNNIVDKPLLTEQFDDIDNSIPQLDVLPQQENNKITIDTAVNETTTDNIETTPKKKKKQKKKKNKEELNTQVLEITDGSTSQEPVETNQKQTPNIADKKTDNPTNEIPENKHEAENKDILEKSNISNDNTDQSNITHDNNSETIPTPKISPILEKLVALSNTFTAESVQKNQDNDANDWGWGFNETKENKPVEKTYEITETNHDDDNQDWEWQYDDSHTSQNDEEQDWEWEYEEVPDDAEIQGVEGQDWEWEYEEIPDDAEIQGVEGQDWEWEYEEVPAELSDENTVHQNYDISTSDTSLYVSSSPSILNASEIIEKSEIIADNIPHLVLCGLEDNNFIDPYIENNDNIG